jgi:hypothetical protein
MTDVPMPEVFDASNYHKKLTREDRGRVASFVEKLHRDTDGRLLPSELEQYAIIMYLVDQIDSEIARAGVVGVDPALVETGRKYRDALLAGLRKVRESDDRPPQMLDQMRAGLNEDGLDWKETDESKEAAGEDTGDGSSLSDENPVRDAKDGVLPSGGDNPDGEG